MIKVELDDTIAPGIYIAWGYRHVSYGDVSNIIVHPDMTHICVHPTAIQKETAMLMTKLRADALTARKNRDEVASGLLTALVGEAAMVGKNNGNRETTDEEALKVIKKFLDNATETLGLLDKKAAGDASALAAPRSQAEREIVILSAYMPAQMTEAELRAEIASFKAANAGTNIGAVMKHLQTNFGGTYDGKLASQIAKEA